MARPRTLPDNDTLVRHLRAGWTHARIGEEYGTTREAVTALVTRHNLAPLHVGRHRDFIPWTIAPQHRGQAEHRKLWLLSRSVQGDALSPETQASLNRWLDDMDSAAGFPVVVAYSREEGWHYVEREPQDGDCVIRWPAP